MARVLQMQMQGVAEGQQNPPQLRLVQQPGMMFEVLFFFIWFHNRHVVNAFPGRFGFKSVKQTDIHKQLCHFTLDLHHI